MFRLRLNMTQGTLMTGPPVGSEWSKAKQLLMICEEAGDFADQAVNLLL